MMRENFDEYKDMINEYLLDYMPTIDTKSSVLYDAMKYSLTAGRQAAAFRTSSGGL